LLAFAGTLRPQDIELQAAPAKNAGLLPKRRDCGVPIAALAQGQLELVQLELVQLELVLLELVLRRTDVVCQNEKNEYGYRADRQLGGAHRVLPCAAKASMNCYACELLQL
jgi:hypothetical protein